MSLLMFEAGEEWWNEVILGQTIGVQYRGDGVDHERLLIHPCSADRTMWFTASPDLDEYAEAEPAGVDADIINTCPLPDDGT